MPFATFLLRFLLLLALKRLQLKVAVIACSKKVLPTDMTDMADFPVFGCEWFVAVSAYSCLLVLLHLLRRQRHHIHIVPYYSTDLSGFGHNVIIKSVS